MLKMTSTPPTDSFFFLSVEGQILTEHNADENGLGAGLRLPERGILSRKSTLSNDTVPT